MSRFMPWLARLLLVGIFGYAGFQKLQEPAQFASALAAYRLTPAILNQVAAVWLPWLECLLALLLLVGIWVRAAALLSGMLALLFLGAVLSALWRGLEIQCGCFGTQQLGWWTVGLELLLLLTAFYLWYRNPPENSDESIDR